MARGLGIDVDRAFMFTFALGGGLAGLGGALAIQVVGLDPTFALGYLVYVLIVVAVGGLGSIGGSFAAAVVLGISDMAGKYYFPWLGAFLIYLVMVGAADVAPAGPVWKALSTRHFESSLFQQSAGGRWKSCSGCARCCRSSSRRTTSRSRARSRSRRCSRCRST